MSKYYFNFKITEKEKIKAVKEFLKEHPKVGDTWEDAEVFVVSTNDEGFRNAMLKTFEWVPGSYDFIK